jgi:tubulin polyglutamylase TTLL9
MDNLYVHLTNVSIQKKADGYDRDVGCKFDLHSLKLFMASRHGMDAIDELFHDMQCIVTRSLLSVADTMVHDRNCFELYGYDIIIDDKLKPFLIEVNASPSLTAEHATDRDLKMRLLSDVLDVLDLEGVNTGDETEVGGFRLIWSGGPTDTVVVGGHSTALGTVPVPRVHTREASAPVRSSVTK